MTEELYRVILKGYSTEKGEYYIEEDFSKLFNITIDKAKDLLKSSPVTIKENLSLEHANQYKVKIEETGALCEIETMRFDTSGLSLK